MYRIEPSLKAITFGALDNAWHGELAEHETALYAAISAGVILRSKFPMFEIVVGLIIVFIAVLLFGAAIDRVYQDFKKDKD